MVGQVDLEAHWALRRALSSKPWHRGVAQALLAAFQAPAIASGGHRRLSHLSHLPLWPTVLNEHE